MDKKESIVNRFSATQVELAKYVKIDPIEFEDRKGWVSYGEGNNYGNSHRHRIVSQLRIQGVCADAGGNTPCGTGFRGRRERLF